jgi:hypothetical protein
MIRIMNFGGCGMFIQRLDLFQILGFAFSELPPMVGSQFFHAPLDGFGKWRA